MIGGTTMERVINERYGFITEDDVSDLVKAAPDMMVLIRCGCGRRTCRMDQVADQIAEISEGDDYVRDVALIADNFQRVKEGRPYIPATGVMVKN